MNKILITGGAGNVGGALARKLVENQNYYFLFLVLNPISKILMNHQERLECAVLLMKNIVCGPTGQFDQEAWGILGIGGAATWKMGQDRKKK